MTIFIIFYLICLFSYFFTRDMGLRIRCINKYLLAMMYLSLAFFFLFQNGGLGSRKDLLLAGLSLCFLGDVFLVFDFLRGGDFFFAGNLCFIFYELGILARYKETNVWRIAVTLIALLAGSAFFVLTKKLFIQKKKEKMLFPMAMYLCAILLDGLLGLLLMIFVKDGSCLRMGMGTFLFMISDLILFFKMLVYDDIWLDRANSLAYFIGILLVVLSMR